MFYLILVLAVGVERLAELRVARRNAQWSHERGGCEYGGGDYPRVGVTCSLPVSAGSQAPP